MLYFRDYHWLVVPGRTFFEIHVGAGARAMEDLQWHLVIHYVAGGARWRRVRQADRPSIEVRVGFFEPGVRRWTELEEVSFWAGERRPEIYSEAGLLEVRYRPESGEKDARSRLSDHIWRVAKREGRMFTVELAAFADGRDIIKELAGIAVTTDGEEAEELEPDEEFWKKNAQLYLVENVPLGVVRVAVARNAGDPEKVARKQAKSLLDLDDVQGVKLWDFAGNKEGYASHHADVNVTLHFNGEYEG